MCYKKKARVSKAAKWTFRLFSCDFDPRSVEASKHIEAPTDSNLELIYLTIFQRGGPWKMKFLSVDL